MADWAEPFRASYRFMRVSRSSGREIAQLDQFEQSGSITRNLDTQTKESGTARIVGSLDIGSDLVRVYLDAEGLYTGRRESVALGTFLASVSKREVDGPVSSSSVDLDGRLLEVSEDDFEAPVSIPAGSSPVDAAIEILEGCGLDVVSDESDYTLSATWTFGMESDEQGKLSAVNRLLEIAGFSSAVTDTMGNVVLRRYTDPASRPVEHSFTEGVDARFLSSVTDELDASDVHNVVKVVYSYQSGEVIGVAEDTDPESPYSIPSIGRRKVRVERYSDEVDQDTADAKALELLSNERSVTRKVSVRHVYAPGLSISSAVDFSYPTAGIEGKFAIRSMDIDLGAGCMVTSEIRRSER